jgi:hypothetical protein
LEKSFTLEENTLAKGFGKPNELTRMFTSKVSFGCSPR